MACAVLGRPIRSNPSNESIFAGPVRGTFFNHVRQQVSAPGHLIPKGLSGQTAKPPLIADGCSKIFAPLLIVDTCNAHSLF